MGRRLAALVLGTLLLAGPARAQSPDAGPGEDVRRRIEHARLRVWLDDGPRAVRSARATPEGLAFADNVARGEELVVAGAIVRVPRAESPIAWSAVRAVDVRRSRVAAGALAGLATGAIVLAVQGVDTHRSGYQFRIANVAGWTIVGAGAGALTSRWRRVWAPEGGPAAAVVVREHYLPGEATAIGFAATLAPVVLGATIVPPGNDSEFAWEAALAGGAIAGLVAGPAIGLTSGGRGDLARRGLIIRAVSSGVVGLGVLGVIAAIDGETVATESIAMFGLGVAAAAVGTISAVHDLVVTESATEKGRTPIAFAIDGRGRPLAQVRF